MKERYTRTVGWVFLTLGVLGLFTNQLWGLFQFDALANFVYILLGILAFAAVSNKKSKWFTLIAPPILLVLGVTGFFIPSLGWIHLEASENFLHLFLGGWGVYVGVYKRG